MKRRFGSKLAIPALLLTGILLVASLSIALATPHPAALVVDPIHLPIIMDGAGFGAGSVRGQVIDAVEGTLLDGVLVCNFMNDECQHTDENGEYIFPSIPSGYRLFTAEAENYAELTLSIRVHPGEVAVLNFAVSPDDLTTEGQYRIVLTWAEDPRDLDAHLWTPFDVIWDKDGNGTITDGSVPGEPDEMRPHIFFDFKGDCDPENPMDPPTAACLDKDDTNGLGPETITILEPQQSGEIHYGVIRFEPACGGQSCPTPLEGSGARVQLYDYTGLREDAYFSIPPTGNDDNLYMWYVFKIDYHLEDHELDLIEVNCFTSRPDPFDEIPSCPTPP